MTRRFKAWGHYLVLLLPLGAGVGGAVGFALGRPDLWGLTGAGLGILLSVALAIGTDPADSP